MDSPQIRELEKFANDFKLRRIKLGVSVVLMADVNYLKFIHIHIVFEYTLIICTELFTYMTHVLVFT